MLREVHLGTEGESFEVDASPQESVRTPQHKPRCDGEHAGRVLTLAQGSPTYRNPAVPAWPWERAVFH
ncbi:hypothetical protein AAFF_G00161750 [Aldrovandia affinis]|uniref:Uncharacterized protein n=1 Tax=Aldrovandia affinis TaxID=143900 RepID=A0AAD7W878_9TELE|nr:hypothetical protein AAFF_G00161750 [Aldrovandia affinis]